MTNSIGMILVWIPPGEFTMGSPRHEEGREEDEAQHRVRITRPFYLSAHEVTVAQFRQFVEETGYVTDSERTPVLSIYLPTPHRRNDASISTWRSPAFVQGDDHPIVWISCNDAGAFCEWLSRKEGHKYRLPTEAEWEYACRAGSSTRFCCGDADVDLYQVANVVMLMPKDNGGVEIWPRPYPFTSPVGHFQPNDFGLYDMHGNASEWCSDWYASGNCRRSRERDPKGPATGEYRVLRGGAFFLSSRYARSANRNYLGPSAADDSSGFRPARDYP